MSNEFMVPGRRQGKSMANALAFCAINDADPVVAGRVVEPDPAKPSRGAVFTLKSGTRCFLPAGACRALPEGYPKWDL